MITNKRKSKITSLLLTTLVLTENADMNLHFCITDIYEEFIEIRFKFIKKAIYKGIKDDFKKDDNLCTQLICIWIRDYLKEIQLQKHKQ